MKKSFGSHHSKLKTEGTNKIEDNFTCMSFVACCTALKISENQTQKQSLKQTKPNQPNKKKLHVVFQR